MAKQSTKPSATANAPAAVVAEKVAKAPKAEKAAAAVADKPATEKVAKTPKAEKVAAATAEKSASEKPVTEKVVKAKAPKAEKVAAAAPVVPAVAAPVTEASASAEPVASVSAEFGDFMGKLQQLGAMISTLKTEFRSLEKKASRELKTAAKASHKRKRKTGNRSPSGFVKPTLISDELASFLGKTKGTEMARTEVTREINAYIRLNQLQDSSNGRRINADTKLSSLLKLASGEELTYFNLQRYMSPHFAKTAAPAVVASA